MSDEPVLCFDGDSAGRSAAYRAVDIALPRLQPGKSLKFALLPEGQDPDDLVRSGGREAVAEVLAQRAPAGADAVDARDRGGRASTRRSAAPRWKRASRRSPPVIGNEMVRKYYRQDFAARLRALFAPE